MILYKEIPLKFRLRIARKTYHPQIDVPQRHVSNVFAPPSLIQWSPAASDLKHKNAPCNNKSGIAYRAALVRMSFPRSKWIVALNADGRSMEGKLGANEKVNCFSKWVCENRGLLYFFRSNRSWLVVTEISGCGVFAFGIRRQLQSTTIVLFESNIRFSYAR